jgi:UDP-galactopyranose mutase
MTSPSELYARYRALAEQTARVHFVGRLATYRYYNMDQVVAQALTTYARMTGAKAETNGRRKAARLASATSAA